MPAEELAKIGQVPSSLEEALDALEADQAYLTAGGVFTDDLIETWIDYKRLQRDRRSAPPAPSVGVHALLRHLRTSDPGGRRQAAQYTQTVVPIGSMLFAQIQSIASLLTRTHPCDTG